MAVQIRVILSSPSDASFSDHFSLQKILFVYKVLEFVISICDKGIHVGFVVVLGRQKIMVLFPPLVSLGKYSQKYLSSVISDYSLAPQVLLYL